MKTIGTALQSLGALVLSIFGLRGFGSSAPTAAFQVSPPSPVVGQPATFLDTSPGTPTSWSWSFGDGAASFNQNPTHTYASPGHYSVVLRASNSSGSTTLSQDVAVTGADTLRFNSAGQHPFLATLSARNQRTGEVGPGFAIAQTDVFGYFSLPSLTGNADNPEVFVKVLDGTALNGHYWVFHGGLTDLEYTLTIQDESTGQVRSYLKPAGSADGGFDTSAFPAAAGASVWPGNSASLMSWAMGMAPRSHAAARPKVSVVDIRVSPDNPVQQQITRMTVENLPTTSIHDIVWTLEPGIVSEDKEPIHAFSTPGLHHVLAKDLIGGSTWSKDVTVSPYDTLRLLPSAVPNDVQEFLIRLTARDPRTERIGQGYAFANNSLYGSFSLPDFTQNRGNAEVIVKMLDGRPINGKFWEFHGGLTDVQWTMSIQYKLSSNLSISKYYFKDSGSKTGGYDTSGFSADELPLITSISPTSGTFGTTIRILGNNLYGNKIEPFFDDSVGHLKNEKYPLKWVAGGIDLSTGLNFMDVQPTNPHGLTLTGPLTLPISLAVDHYLATAPVPFVLNVQVGPTMTPVPTTPTPDFTHPPEITPTPTFPPPTVTVPPGGGPVITGTSLDDVTVGTVYDIFGTNLGTCSAAMASLQNASATYPLICQFGDSQSMQVQVPMGVPIGPYHTCVTVQGQTGCASFNTNMH